MERPPGGRPKSVDIWEHVTVLEGKQVKCKYCGLVFAASANRIKSHIHQIKGQGIRPCTGFNRRVNSDLKDNLIDSQGLSKLDRPNEYNKLNKTMLDIYMSSKTIWEGLMAHPQPQSNKEAKHNEKFQVGPFSVSTTVNERDLQLIQYVFEYSREPYRVFSCSNVHLNQSDFTTLKPETFLDAWVIDAFVEILTDRERKKKTMPLNWYLPVMFSNGALSGNISSFMDFVKQHKIRENYMSDLVYCEKMFIPIHIEKNSHGHFYLYVVHVRNQEVEIWDSLSDQFINKIERDETIQKLLLAVDKLFPNAEFTKFHWRMANDILLQSNGFDCGIFVINFMQQSENYVNRNPLFKFDSEEERLDLALKLLKSDLNKEKEILYNKASKRHNAKGENDEDSDYSRFKRKRVDSSKDVRRVACIELDDSERREDGRNNVHLKIGCSKGYVLPAINLVGEQFQSYIEQIWEWIMDDDVSAIGIWAMGGAGKTALATHIHNKLLEEAASDFDHVIWITASQHESICQLQKVVARSINLDISDEYEVKRIAGKLLQAFKHMNKCVLILDDVWNHVCLEEIGFPISDNRIKLIFTTRLWEVCQGMNCKKKNIIKVEPLDEKDSWDLFKKTLGDHTGLPLELARSLIGYSCGGLPLAIVTIARSMKEKKHAQEWIYMTLSLGNLDNGQYEMVKWVFPILRSSYAFLNNKLQRFFLYCALSSEEYFDHTHADRLIRRFVYEGWMDKLKNQLFAQYVEGYNMLDKLKNNCMLVEDKGWRMHKLVRVMAIGIAEDTNRVMAAAYMNLTEIPDDDKWREDLQKVFLTGNQIQEIPDGTSPRCSQLSTLLLDCNCNLKWISNDFFNNMPALKILDLSETSIERLPDSVSNLECLIALLLSRCKRLSYLPSLAKLQRLVSLDLFYTAITEAPFGMETLVNLRSLNLLYTEKLKMSTSLISKLTNLQSLKVNCTPNSMDVRAQDLQCLKKLQVIVANFCDVEEFNTFVMSFGDLVLFSYHLILGLQEDDLWEKELNEKRCNKMATFKGMDLGNRTVILPENINELYIEDCHQGTRASSLCRVLSFGNNNDPHEIVVFNIKWYDEVENLCCVSPSCPFCSSVQLTNILFLWDLKDLKSMVSPAAPSVHKFTLFSRLRELFIQGCNSMKNLLTPELLAILQNLQVITVESCGSMKEIVGELHLESLPPGGGHLFYHRIVHPTLRSLTLSNLSELNFVYRGIMLCPSLELFSIIDCEKLNPPQIEISNGYALQMDEFLDGYHYWHK